VLIDAGAQILSEAKARVEANGVEVDTFLSSRSGAVCDIVVEQAKLWNADLVVIGTHGRRGIGRSSSAAMPSGRQTAPVPCVA
jgi:nucleotide-binding universal stress UspA family protein